MKFLGWLVIAIRLLLKIPMYFLGLVLHPIAYVSKNWIYNTLTIHKYFLKMFVGRKIDDPIRWNNNKLFLLAYTLLMVLDTSYDRDDPFIAQTVGVKPDDNAFMRWWREYLWSAIRNSWVNFNYWHEIADKNSKLWAMGFYPFVDKTFTVFGVKFRLYLGYPPQDNPPSLQSMFRGV